LSKPRVYREEMVFWSFEEEFEVFRQSSENGILDATSEENDDD
jgi:hypothetical protein